MTTTSRSQAAYKAAATRAARKEFFASYPETADVAQMVIEGFTTDEIVADLCIAHGSVAAVRANLNRWNDYADLADACNF